MCVELQMNHCFSEGHSNNNNNCQTDFKMHSFTSTCYRGYREENTLYEVQSKNILWSKPQNLEKIKIIWRYFKNTDFEAHPQRFKFNESEVGPGNLHLSKFSKQLAFKVTMYHNFKNRGIKNVFRILHKI